MIEEQALDLLLEQAVPMMWLDNLEETECQMKLEKSHVFSKKYEKKKENIIAAYIREKGKTETNSISNRSAVQRPRRIKIRYLLVAILLLLASTVTIMASEMVQGVLNHITYTVYHNFLSIDNKEDVNTIEQGETEPLFVPKRPGYIPAEFQLIEEEIDEVFGEINIRWQKQDGITMFYFQFNPQYGGISVTSDGTAPEDVTVGNHEAKLVEDKDGVRSIFFEEGEYIYLLTAKLEKKELIKIMESIK